MTDVDKPIYDALDALFANDGDSSTGGLLPDERRLGNAALAPLFLGVQRSGLLRTGSSGASFAPACNPSPATPSSCSTSTTNFKHRDPLGSLKQSAAQSKSESDHKIQAQLRGIII